MKILRIFILVMISAYTFSALNPCQAKIAYSHLTQGYWQIWIMEDDGSSERQMTFSEQDKRGPTWSADGTRMAYRTNNGQLYLLSLNTGDEREILRRLHNINNPHWSGVRNEIIFVRFNPQAMDISDIWKSDVNGNDPILLTRDKKLKYQPVFSPGGEQVAFVRAEGINRHHIWIMGTDGRDHAQITSGNGLNVLPSFAPDGTFLVFASNRDGNFEIYRVDLETRQPVRLTDHPDLDTSPCVSAGGMDIVFVSNRDGTQQLWKLDSDSNGLIQLTHGPEESIEPAFLHPMAQEEIEQ